MSPRRFCRFYLVREEMLCKDVRLQCSLRRAWFNGSPHAGLPYTPVSRDRSSLSDGNESDGHEAACWR